MGFGLKKEDKIIQKPTEEKKYQEFNFKNSDVEEEETTPHVVNIKSKVDGKEPKFDVYIGRPSEFGNPFVIGKDGDRDEVIDKFEAYLISNPELMQKVKEKLKGKTVGCFCHPLKCHGDILIKYANPELSIKSGIKNKV